VFLRHPGTPTIRDTEALAFPSGTPIMIPLLSQDVSFYYSSPQYTLPTQWAGYVTGVPGKTLEVRAYLRKESGANLFSTFSNSLHFRGFCPVGNHLYPRWSGDLHCQQQPGPCCCCAELSARASRPPRARWRRTGGHRAFFSEGWFFLYLFSFGALINLVSTVGTYLWASPYTRELIKMVLLKRSTSTEAYSTMMDSLFVCAKLANWVAADMACEMEVQISKSVYQAKGGHFRWANLLKNTALLAHCIAARWLSRTVISLLS
jgi:hypothetical protein